MENKAIKFLLGTDRHIGEELSTPGDDQSEKRVAMLPGDVKTLIERWAGSGIDAEVVVVAGAGEYAGAPDDDYVRAGARVVREEDLIRSNWEPDIVHALKEPSAYEDEVKGQFIRIGALHVRDVTGHSPFVRMTRSCAAIIDGSEMGGFGYKLRGSYPYPLRQSMSAFAGHLGGTDIANSRPSPKQVVICGFGVAGQAGLKAIISLVSNVSITVVDPSAAARSKAEEFRKEGSIEVKTVDGDSLIGMSLQDVDAVLLTAFKPADKPYLLSLEQARQMTGCKLIVDISADEGPSVEVPGLENLTGEDARVHVRNYLKQDGVTYDADTHMPRRDPANASKVHSEAVLDYIFALGKLVAERGGAGAAADYLLSLRTDRGDASDVSSAMEKDLAAGLYSVHGDIVHRVVQEDPELRSRIESFMTAATA